MTAAPQVSPPPTPSIMIVCPRAIRPSRTASSSASGIDADEVLPCWSTVTSIRSRGSPSLRQVPCIMRIFAWWGISQSICAALKRDFLKEMDRELKNRLAVHCHKRLTAYRAAADAAGRAQNIRMAAIRMQSAGYYARLFRSLQYDRARAVAE